MWNFLIHKLLIQFLFYSFISAGHVCTAYLFAGLIYEMDTAAMTDTLNMLTSLLLGSIRFYLSAFNSWWNEGRLTDHCSEFLIGKW